MSEFGIYRMELSDLNEVLDIEEESFSLPWSRWMFERELEENERSHFFVLKDGSRVLGYIGFWIVFDEAHIVTIAVRKDFRHRGIGTILMASALIAAYEMGAQRATLEVRLTNTNAQKMYEKFGFEIVSVRKKFYTDTGEDAYVMYIYNLDEKIGEIRALGKKAEEKLLNSNNVC
ncbi:MAG: ribosomal protein S18-alanine N-acetyltransferase [bacterium]